MSGGSGSHRITFKTDKSVIQKFTFLKSNKSVTLAILTTT